MESVCSGSLKRARSGGNGSPIPSCLVDGCTADLSICREYHRRHKVCELHSKQSKVFIKGSEQRFCQQCSRFHSLVEFDEGKRSCRKRLEGHNRRRRKPPQFNSIAVNPQRFFSISQGTRYINFGDSSTGSFLGNTDDESVVYDNPRSLSLSFRSSMAETVKGEDEGFGVWQGNTSLFHGNFHLENKHGDQHRMLPAGFNLAVDSNRALSLLSSPPPQSRPGLNSAVNSFFSSLNNAGVESETARVPAFGAAGRTGNLRSQMLQSFPDSSSSSYSQQALSFSWE